MNEDENKSESKKLNKTKKYLFQKWKKQANDKMNIVKITQNLNGIIMSYLVRLQDFGTSTMYFCLPHAIYI